MWKRRPSSLWFRLLEHNQSICLLITGSNISEWLGIPGTGKKFDGMGFVMVKVIIYPRVHG